MLRIVLDTNVLASATISKSGAPGQILQAFLRGEVELITSPVLLAELRDVLARPHIKKRRWMSAEQVAALQRLLEKAALQASSENPAQGIAPDPDDDYVLSAAEALQADYIVSGDRHLLALKEYKGIEIVTPAAFLKL